MVPHAWSGSFTSLARCAADDVVLLSLPTVNNPLSSKVH
jgi:hypothetical protein